MPSPSRLGRRAGDPAGKMVFCGVKEKLPYYSHRLLVKPGITGWAQVMYPYASSMAQTKEKLQYDLFYVKNIGFFWTWPFFSRPYVLSYILGREM